jgi:hypothetical protein
MNISNRFRVKAIGEQVSYIGILILPIVLYFVPVEWLNKQHTFCLFKNIFGQECLGCGITRAVVSAIQLDFYVAYHYNKLVVIVLPLLAYVWMKIVIKMFRKLWQ